jgi:hypothetical protein
MKEWLILTASLPPSPSALRVRIWRALKATGCATLRDGVYILPASAATAAGLWSIEKSIQDAGTEAHMLVVTARDAAQDQTFTALFDRSEAYTEFMQSLKDTRKRARSAAEADLRKAIRALGHQLQVLQETDFFPGKATAAAAAGLETLRMEIERQFSPGEPLAERGHGTVATRSKESVKGKTWATRKRPWVDRLATAWLVTRLIDPTARFVWLEDARKCPRSALGFDFDGATFSHVGDKVTFEVVAETFSLEADAALRHLGELVHYIDIGGIPVNEAAGIETLVRGLQAQHADDDALLAAALPLFDALYIAMQTTAP